MKTSALLSFQFYKLLFLFNIACSLLAVALIMFGLGYIHAVGLFLAKILGFAGAVVLHQYTAKETYYYFRNAGRRMRHVIAISFTIDVFVFISLSLLVNLIAQCSRIL